MLKNGKREWMIKALRETEQQTGEQLLPKGVADADLTVLQLKEAYSHVGVSLFAGEAVKDRNGKANPRLSNNRKWLLGVQRSALGRAMNASAQKFAAMFRRAQRLEQARVGDAKPGDGGNNNNSSTLQAELEETLNRSLGLSEGAVVNATENGAIVSTTDVNAEGDVSFSIQPGNEGAGKSDPATKSKAVDSKTNEWYGYTDEQRERFQEAIRETEGIYDQATFGDSRGNRSVPETNRERVLRSYRSVAVGEIVLVDQGIKPLFHEAWIFTPQEAEVLVNSIRQKFPHLEAEAWGPHVVIWHPDAIKAVLATDPAHYGSDAREAVRKAAESDEIGELLGNHARTRMTGDTVVQYYVNGEPIAGGFITQRAVSEKLAEQRRQVFEMTFGESVSVELASKGKPTGESNHSTVEKVDADISGTNTASQTSSTSQIEQSQDQFKEDGDVSFSLGPDVVRRWVERQKPIAAPKVKLPYGGEMQLRKFAQDMWKQLPDSTKTRDGRTVIIKHNAQGTEDVLFEHLITSHNKDGSRTWTDRGRITSLSRIPSTIENARPRFTTKSGSHVYIQRYDDGIHHYVITRSDGVMTHHGQADALTTQWWRRANDDVFLEAERLDLMGSPSSARSEQGGASGASLTSPSQSNDAPGMPSLTTRPVNENTSAQPNSQEGNLSNSLIPFNSGETIYENFKSSKGQLKVAADVMIDGKNLHLKDFAIYPVGADKFELSSQEIQKLLRELRDKAKLLGFDTLRITGLRYSGAKPGKEVNFTIKLK